MLGDVINGILNVLNLFGIFVGDFDIELLLKRHDQFDRIKGVSTKVFHEGCLVGNLVLIYAKLLGHNLFYSFCNRSHLLHLLLVFDLIMDQTGLTK
ncbi:MAG: hypothetical protein A2091_02445 [Desulfuromonadales bacterium GWD2_61_12]|nr:MAG: hypothetical protein A2005_13115 [Desulfuromonadales bacterium GWC2_61_20]OGR35371.1 MAG: hypothetical protein A2091_02445 [Desulfuromonadales bacterium GWD2_61_12]